MSENKLAYEYKLIALFNILTSLLSKKRFDVLVNGGAAITLQFQRSPFRPMTRTVFVPWNQVNLSKFTKINSLEN